MIHIKNFLDIFPYTDGNYYYYDRETEMIYRLEIGGSHQKVKTAVNEYKLKKQEEYKVD